MAGNHSFKIGERILMHHTFSVFCVHLHAQRTLYLSDETRDAEASFIAFLFTDLADDLRIDQINDLPFLRLDDTHAFEQPDLGCGYADAHLIAHSLEHIIQLLFHAISYLTDRFAFLCQNVVSLDENVS